MGNIITIDPFIGAIIHICGIGAKERVPVIFTAPTPWEGDFKLQVWNGPAKNTEYTMPVGSLLVADETMTAVFEPEAQELPAQASLYYEITNTTTKRILFKGDLKTLK